MATNWPNSVQTFTNPTAGSALNSPSHADQHTTVNDTVEALQEYAGLVLVKTQTIGSGVSSVTVTDAFDSRFENYHITYFVEDCSVTAFTMQVTLDSITTAYYGARQYTNWTGTVASVPNDNQAQWGIGAIRTAVGGGGKMDIYKPYVSGTKTFMFSQNVYMTSGGYWDTFGGYQDSSASVSDITFKPSGGTMTGGTIRVYGYNNG
jgi:hypothetical protein